MEKRIKVLVTGSQGFLGKNLVARLNELDQYTVIEFKRGDSLDELKSLILTADFIFHLAGENRPKNIEQYTIVNEGLTQSISNFIQESGRKIPLVFASSAQATQDNPYGISKLNAETVVRELSKTFSVPTFIYRLPGVFGKWCKPNYNSVVATFCNNVAHDLPIHINNHDAKLSLVYIDDVIDEFVSLILNRSSGHKYCEISPVYEVTLGRLARCIESFKHSRKSLIIEAVGHGFMRALYATYISHLSPEKFTYDLPIYSDQRGKFVEMLKTAESGQFSYFTALPGVTRGGHYHHTKSEKFLVVKGRASFKFRQIITNEKYEIEVSGDIPRVVETIPGWAHDITNIGEEEMVVILWANEIFNHNKPDTIASALI